MHVTITFSLKQGETRTSSGPITVPLSQNETRLQLFKFILSSSGVNY